MTADASIIIAAYNVEDYIQHAIDSALSQNEVSVEVIIVDDHSRDKTWDILSAQTDPRVKIFKTLENSGPSATRNLAINNASGEWIAVLDGDDRMENDRLSHMIKIANKNNADMVIDNLSIYDEDDKSRRDMFDANRLEEISPLTLADYINGNLFKQSAQHTLGYTKPVIKREFLNSHSIRYNPDIHIGEDYDLMARLLAVGATCVTDANAGYIYTVRKGSISHRLTPQDMERVIEIDTSFKNEYAKHLDDREKAAQRRRDKSVKDIYAFTLLVDGIKTKNIKMIMRSIMLSPLSCRHLSAAIKNRMT